MLFTTLILTLKIQLIKHDDDAMSRLLVQTLHAERREERI
jgi:hypothetical protein